MINNSVLEIDSCGVPQETDDSIIDNELSLPFDNELSNSMCNKVRKMIQKRNVSLKSRHALNQNETPCEGFTTKLKDTELDNYGRTISVCSENCACKISYMNGI